MSSFAVTGTNYFHANSTAADSLAVGAQSIAVGLPLPHGLSSSDAATKTRRALFQIDRYTLFMFFPVRYCERSRSPSIRTTTHIRQKDSVGVALLWCGTALPCVRHQYLDILNSNVRHPHAERIHMSKVSMRDGQAVSIVWHPGRADCGPMAYEGPKGHSISVPIARKGANCLSKCDRWSSKRLLCSALPGLLIITGPR